MTYLTQPRYCDDILGNVSYPPSPFLPNGPLGSCISLSHAYGLRSLKHKPEITTPLILGTETNKSDDSGEEGLRQS